MSAERGDVEVIMASISSADHTVVAEGQDTASTDDARKAALKKVFIDPITDAGYDPDQSLQALAACYRTANYPKEKAEVLSAFLQTYAKSDSDLERLGLISSETASHLDRLHFLN